MPQAIPEDSSIAGPGASRASTRHILGFVYFTFICYLSIGLPLAVLPPYVHLRMGYSAVLAGLVISIQYISRQGLGFDLPTRMLTLPASARPPATARPVQHACPVIAPRVTHQ